MVTPPPGVPAVVTVVTMRSTLMARFCTAGEPSKLTSRSQTSPSRFVVGGTMTPTVFVSACA
jgi:hypothetical protein